MNFSFDFLNIHIIHLAQLGVNTVKGTIEVVDNAWNSTYIILENHH